MTTTTTTINVRDGRRFFPLPIGFWGQGQTLRVCTQCGATWAQGHRDVPGHKLPISWSRCSAFPRAVQS